jgi:hypothetical protein
LTEQPFQQPPLSSTALPLQIAARVLAKAGSRPVSEEMLADDIAQGAPVNADGTLNLVHYAAWLVRGMGRGD